MSDPEQAITAHDSAVAEAGLEIWIGSEPTFTLRNSEQPQWLSQALGGDKEEYALRLTRELALRHPASAVLRTVGRQYGGEKRPRWSFGLYELRDGAHFWQGPPDPLLLDSAVTPPQDVGAFADAIQQGIEKQAFACKRVDSLSTGDEIRLLVRQDGATIVIEDGDTRLARPALNDQKTPEQGLADTLADEGLWLFVIEILDIGDGQRSACIELPAFTRVGELMACLEVIGAAARDVAVPCLLLRGYPPPVDASVAWTTVTPDPAVIEVNQAPQPDIRAFHAANRELFEVAAAQGLSPFRLQYNGTISDSGGGGQFTLGGHSALDSPFFKHPHLLPRLVRYFNLHPSLSYWFATNYVGSTSQSPRADENTSDSFQELALALEQLDQASDIDPEFLYLSLAPFLADSSGNTHRSELNIEKLWNTWLPQRGCLGLLEFRAFRMPLSPERSLAIGMLLRAITAMLAGHDLAPDLVRWREQLHDRFALPFFLRQDLNAVLADLQRHGFGLGEEIDQQLIATPDRPLWSVEFEGCHLTLEPGVEFWPLVGDVASQERGGSRLVDSSTLRLQLCLRSGGGQTKLNDWQVSTAGTIVPLRDERLDGEAVRLIGLRYRDFVPWRGLHPSIKPTAPLTLYLAHPELHEALELKLYNWRADSIPYDGLPKDTDDALERCMQRLVTKRVSRSGLAQTQSAKQEALSDYLFDLRRVPND
jgi:uncharacterized protein (DUF2126 family)